VGIEILLDVRGLSYLEEGTGAGGIRLRGDGLGPYRAGRCRNRTLLTATTGRGKV
jgi:hypothetical protein